MWIESGLGHAEINKLDKIRQNNVDEFLKLSKIVVSVNFFSDVFLQFSSITVKF